MKEKVVIIKTQFDSILEEVINGNSGKRIQESFNTKNLPDTNYEVEKANINHSRDFDYIFRKLNGMIHNCIYWFSFDSKEKAIEFNNLLNSKRELLRHRKADPRVTPAKSNKYQESYVLYVGVRRGGINKKELTNICGRIIQHFGYYEKGSTQGL